MEMAPAPSSSLVLAKLFRGLADPARLSCLLAVRQQARTVSQIVAATGLSQPNVSKHLACLRDCGLVRAERSGRCVTYCLCGTGVEEVLRAADALLARTGAAIAACPEYQPAQESAGTGPHPLPPLPQGEGDVCSTPSC
jgi:ArsR family transcriptional regulator, cadmium/lead-responsive transcriptional repressor